MNSPALIIQIIAFVLYVLAQATFGKNMVLFQTALCFFYVAFLLGVPFETGRLTQMFIGFLVGFMVDIFYDSLGIHAAACVFLMFIRPIWIKMVTPRGGYDPGDEPKAKMLGFQWYATYALPLLFAHHFVLLFVEMGGFQLFWFTINKVIFSTLFSFTVIIIFQYLFYSSRRSTL